MKAYDDPSRPWVAWRPRSRDPRVASTRIRCLNLISGLQARGWQAELFRSARADTYGIVVYSKRYDDAALREAQVLASRGVRIVFDLCDNHFYNPHGLRALACAGDQIRAMTALADQVVVSTEALADVLRRELRYEKSIRVIGDAVETAPDETLPAAWLGLPDRLRWLRLRFWLQARRSEGRVPLVWFGVHGGPNAEYGMEDLSQLREVLERINLHFPLSLTVISNSRSKYRRVFSGWQIPTSYLEWRPVTFLTALRAHEVAVIPMTLNPFTMTKSNNRVALALACGLSVIADAIPSYEEFREVCVLDDWEGGLVRYLADPELRRGEAMKGQAMVQQRWSLDRVVDQWEEVFTNLSG